MGHVTASVGESKGKESEREWKVLRMTGTDRDTYLNGKGMG